MKIQKEFKVTPHYIEIEHDVDMGYRMGVFLCIGQYIHNLRPRQAKSIDDLKTFQSINEYVEQNEKAFIFLGEGQHKIKRKAEQVACYEALNKLKGYSI